MTTHLSLVVARMHGVLVVRPRSSVFHVATTNDLTPSGRWVRRTTCSARTRRPSVLVRTGVTVDLGGRRMCARCAARLSAVARRAAQPISREQRVAFYSGITLADLVVAIALCSTVDESHAVGSVLALLFPPAPARRPVEANGRQALYDVQHQLLRQRRALRAAERTPEELEAAARLREQQAADDALLMAGHRKGDRIARVQDRANAGQYVPTWDRPLIGA